MKWYHLNETTVILEETNKDDPIEKFIHIRENLEKLDGIIEAWFTKYSLAIKINPEKIDIGFLKKKFSQFSLSIGEPNCSHHIIPTNYNVLGCDLNSMSLKLGLSINHIIKVHSSITYLVTMIGFLPGFAYLDGLPDSIHFPRKENPCISVPAGSVAIGGSQTGIYPFAGPGGWNIIGTTDFKLLDDQGLSTLRPGDFVQFKVL